MSINYKAIENLVDLTQCRDEREHETQSVLRLQKICSCDAWAFAKFRPPDSLTVVSDRSGFADETTKLWRVTDNLVGKDYMVTHFYRLDPQSEADLKKFKRPVTHADLENNNNFWDSPRYKDFFKHLGGKYLLTFPIYRIGALIGAYVSLRSLKPRGERLGTGFFDEEICAMGDVFGRLRTSLSWVRSKVPMDPDDRHIMEQVKRLTPREQQVACLMTSEFSYRQIADHLPDGPSENTIKNHITSILSKVFDNHPSLGNKADPTADEERNQRTREGKELARIFRNCLTRNREELKRIVCPEARDLL